MNTADATLQRVKGIKKVFDNAMREFVDKFKDNRIVNFYTDAQADEIFTSTEGITGITPLGEEQTPDSMTLIDGYTKTISHGRHGGAVIVSHTAQIERKDSTIRMDEFIIKQSRKALEAAKAYVLFNAFAMLNNAFDSSATTLAPDDVELCGTHSWASGETFDNSATAALDADAIDDMEQYAGEFMDSVDATNTPWIHDFDTIIVKKGSDNARMAIRLFAMGINPISVADINIYPGAKTVREVPYITATNRNYWFARDTQYENSLALGFTEMPEMTEPKIQDNESIRSNVLTHYKRGIINQPHDYYGSDGTT